MDKILGALMIGGLAVALSAGTPVAAGPAAAGWQGKEQKRVAQGVYSAN